MQNRGRLIIGLAAVLGAVVFVSTAAADKPVMSTFSNVHFSTVLSDVCSFDVNVSGVVSGTEVDYVDKAGAVTRSEIHQVEQDTFSANGKTLTGMPFTTNFSLRFDSNGHLVSLVGTGVLEKVLLPDGSLFVGAGWVDFV